MARRSLERNDGDICLLIGPEDGPGSCPRSIATPAGSPKQLSKLQKKNGPVITVLGQVLVVSYGMYLYVPRNVKLFTTIQDRL